MVIKRPSGRHRTFRLLEPRGDGKYFTTRPPELEGVNAAYLSGRLTEEQAHNRLKELIGAWSRPRHSTISKTRSEAFIEDFWMRSPKGASKARKNPRSQTVARCGYLEVAKLLPRVDLQTATVKEVQEALANLPREKQRKVITRINTLWAWAGRPTQQKVPLPRKPKREVQALPLRDLKDFIKTLPSPLGLYAIAAFGTGARPGEVFAMTKDDLRHGGTHIWIDKTWDQTYQAVDTKNGKTGAAFVIKECREALVGWLEVPVEVKKRWWRKSAHAQPFIQATGHDPYILRHSYARHMLSKGASLTDLRMWMRSDMKTIEDYYLKWVQTSAEMDANLKRFDGDEE
jgi:integrase